MDIKALAQDAAPYVVERRHYYHQHPELTGEVLKVIKELAREHMTMIIVTHEMQFARELSDRIIFMEQGIIQAEGTPEEIFHCENERVREFIGKFQS